jgi:hypothetical protein
MIAGLLRSLISKREAYLFRLPAFFAPLPAHGVPIEIAKPRTLKEDPGLGRVSCAFDGERSALKQQVTLGLRVELSIRL